ncbi:MAG: pantoate--beta-alanine ligase [Actinomycetota bacterium]|nr:pantoate--beta-alanine ligase [Actinomycetota bacterium]
MRIVRTVAAVREALAPERAAGRTIALVPTMGAFHAGHEALMRAAREAADVVVVSLFVNPAQFDEGADLGAYPRDEARDATVAGAAGVDLLFAPADEEIYPPGFATVVQVGGPAETLEGAERGPGHFAGVATVVTKLLAIVAPDVVLFGQKDAQQLAVIRRLVGDLNLPVRIEAVPTVREPDGLALSSRNVRLGDEDRERALALRDALREAERANAAGRRDPAAVREAALRAMAARAVEPEYVALVDPETFSPLDAVNGRTLVAVAARVGDVRLIDNSLISSPNKEAP